MKRLLVILFISASVNMMAQKAHHDTTLKNVVRINLTPMAITGTIGSLTVGYERMLHKRQSLSANIGLLQLPELITTEEGEPVEWKSNVVNRGFIGSFDYRFYFSRNRYAKPDGLYWGPYATYYYADNLSRIEFHGDAVTLTGDVQLYANLFMAGVQLGYQFVIGNHWTIDMILLGPGLGYYHFTVGVDYESDLYGNEEYLQGIYDALTTVYPGLKDLIHEDSLDKSGSSRTQGYGFRYVFQVGYRF